MKCGNCEGHDLYHKIKDILNEDDSMITFKSPGLSLVWHRKCYSDFTNDSNIPESAYAQGQVVHSQSTSRLQRQTFEWKTHCMFCTKESHKGVKTMFNVSSFDFCTKLEKYVNDLCDDGLRCRVGDFHKLMALEARYYQQCCTNYYNKAKLANRTRNLCLIHPMMML
jgi:hypothetical protein